MIGVFGFVVGSLWPVYVDSGVDLEEGTWFSALAWSRFEHLENHGFDVGWN